MINKTSLNSIHRALGARMVPFGGWDMPLHYGSQLDEHHAVRNHAGMFDVSHMTVVDIRGPGAKGYLQYLLANDVDRLKKPGKALYSCMLRDDGGVIDDLIAYFFDPDFYRLVVNAATSEKDLDWMQRQTGGNQVHIEARNDLDMIAVQGPLARGIALPLLPDDCATAAALAPFEALLGASWQVARTGYTGEDGFEIMLPRAEAAELWQGLLENGVQPCGLGARDTLRLEAGMNLYGTDMDEQTSPLISGLGWTVAWEPNDRDFIGRQALKTERNQGVKRGFIGLLLEEKGILRNGQPLYLDHECVGNITSGGFSPTLQRSIAMARVVHPCKEGLQVDIRGKRLAVRQVKMPFVRHGKILIDL